MRSEDIFAMGLGLLSPWDVKSVSFEETQDCKELHIHIDFSRGARFVNDKGESVSVYDTEEKEWRHLNFFEHKCYLHCRVPRIRMSDGKVTAPRIWRVFHHWISKARARIDLSGVRRIGIRRDSLTRPLLKSQTMP
ncbi:MAG: hypothetical protein ACI3ZD_16020 [Prevotella sp.]